MLETLCGLAPGTFGSTLAAWHDTIHPDDLDDAVARVQHALASADPYSFEYRTMWPDGTLRWIECRGHVLTDGSGAATSAVGFAVDITARRRHEDGRRAALEGERLVRGRLEFLAELTDRTLAATDHTSLMRAAANAAVPRLGDWCSIHFVPEPGATVDVVVAHSDPSRGQWADRLARRFPYDPDGRRGVAVVMRTGVTEFIEVVTDRMIDEVADRAGVELVEARQVLSDLGISSVITVPLTTKRGVIGAMQFIAAESGRTYDADDVALAELVAGRVGDAVDNMWLTAQHRQIASTLQRALLPPVFPDIAGIDVAVRYFPAGAAVEAGGDFYDVFRTGDARWAVLIGDVCGTGPNAAAVTSIARHTVRAAARHGLDHGAVLDWLNEAVRLSDRDLFCTAAYATLEARGGDWWIESTAGGHPLPVVVSTQGSAELLGRHGRLLGVFEDTVSHVEGRQLLPGDVVVFYTDGITDLAPPHDRTEADVASTVAGFVGLGSADAIADAVHRSVTDRLSAEERADDVALVVLRVLDHPPPA